MADKKLEFKQDTTQLEHQINYSLAEMIAPKLEELLIKTANEKIWAHPQIKDNEIPSTSLAAAVVYDINPQGNTTFELNIFNDEIGGTKEVDVDEYSRRQVTKDPGEVALERSSTGKFLPKGEGKVSKHKRKLANKRHFKLSDGSWITSSAVPAEILNEVVQETITEVLGGG